jgi:hypothetical protein
MIEIGVTHTAANNQITIVDCDCFYHTASWAFRAGVFLSGAVQNIHCVPWLGGIWRESYQNDSRNL